MNHPETSICPRCGEVLHCAIAAGQPTCWCFGLEVNQAQLRQDVESRDQCLCRRCLADYQESEVDGYQVKQQVVTVGGTDFTIETLLDKQQFHDPDGEAEAMGISSATWSFFGALWPSARLLSEYLTTLPLEGRRILEVGCGVGLVSVVVHHAGGNITASDYHPESETFLRRNLALNGLPPMPFIHFDWTDPPETLGQFDMIIGSDVLYQRWHPGQLADFVESHRSDGGEVVIADPRRGNRGKFAQRMDAIGLALNQPDLDEERYGEIGGTRVAHFSEPQPPDQ